MPVNSMGPVTRRGAVTLGSRVLRVPATVSNSVLGMMTGTSTATCSLAGFYAGVLLLAKEVLVRTAPAADPKDVLGARYKPVPDGQGGIRYDASDRTIDFSELGDRFRSFGLKIDQAAPRDLNRIRNDIEHLYSSASPKTVREAIATAFPVVVDLFDWPTRILA